MVKKANILVLVCLLALATVAIGAPKTPLFQMRLADLTPSVDSEPMTFVTTNGSTAFTNVLYVQKTVLLDETALTSAKAGKDGLANPVIDIQFTEAGTTLFADITRENTQKRLAIIIDGKICEAPVIHSEIPGGKAQIGGKLHQGTS